MSNLRIAVRKDPACYQPGEEIAGAAQWAVQTPPEAVEVRLSWYTSGRGILDSCLVETVKLDAPLQEDTRAFKIIAPEAPYSFSGKLISLQWVLELVVLPSKEAAQARIVIAPDGKAIVLQKLDDL